MLGNYHTGICLKGKSKGNCGLDIRNDMESA